MRFSFDEDPAVLMTAAFGHIGLGKNLYSRHDPRSVFPGEIHFVNQHPVNPKPYPQFACQRLEMNVRRALFNGRLDQGVNHLNDAILAGLRLSRFERVILDLLVISQPGILALKQAVHQVQRLKNHLCCSEAELHLAFE